MDELTIKPRGERRRKAKWINRHIAMESGKEQIQGITTKQSYAWELKFTGTADTMEDLEDFFNAQNGSRKKFFWTDGKGVQRIVRFAQDELDIQEKWGFGDDGYGVQGFDCSVALREEV